MVISIWNDSNPFGVQPSVVYKEQSSTGFEAQGKISEKF